MKTARTAITKALILCLALMTAVLVGCGSGGSKSHDVTTDFDGTVYGANSSPYDGEDGVDTDTEFRVGWPEEDYPPPPSFTFRLDRDDGASDWHGVYTKMEHDSDSMTWTFDPSSYLESGHWYRATISDDTGRRQVFFFRTSGDPSDSPAPAASASAAHEGSVEHRVSTRPQAQ